MEYNYDEIKTDIILDEKNDVEKAKNLILSSINLSDNESDLINNIKSAKELEELVKNPGNFLENSSLKEFTELLELVDLMRGIYIA